MTRKRRHILINFPGGGPPDLPVRWCTLIYPWLHGSAPCSICCVLKVLVYTAHSIVSSYVEKGEITMSFSVVQIKYCRVPPSRRLQVTVAWGHKWRAPKRAGTPRRLGSLPPTGLCSFIPLISLLRTIKLSTNNVQYTRLVNTDLYKNLTRVGRDNISFGYCSNIFR